MYNTYPSDYTTYERVNEQIKSNPNQGDLTNDADIVKHYIHVASDQVREYCSRTFVPYIDASHKVLYGDLSRFRILQLGDDALSVSTITDASGDEITSGNYRLRDVTNHISGYPKRYVEISTQANAFGFADYDFEPTFTVDGIWGYSTRSYDNSWDTLSTTSETLTDSTTDIVVADSTLYEVYDYIRIESEFMQVTANDTATDTLTVTRGVNGSTAVAHDGSSTALDVDRWQIEHAVKDATTRLTAFLYQSRQGLGNTIVFQDGTVASQYPSLVWSSLFKYKRLVARSV
jgi:hypothetical protein